MILVPLHTLFYTDVIKLGQQIEIKTNFLAKITFLIQEKTHKSVFSSNFAITHYYHLLLAVFIHKHIF